MAQNRNRSGPPQPPDKLGSLKKDKPPNGTPLPSPPASPKAARSGVNLGDAIGPGIASSTVCAHERDPAAAAVSEVLGTMQGTLGALGKTVDVIGDQMMRVAALGPAVDALYQIKSLRADLDAKHKSQEEEMQRVKARLQEQVRNHIRERLRPEVDRLIAEAVSKVVVERVHRELSSKIPSSVRDEIQEYKQRIMQVKASLYNSEARRHNALIRGEEPLQPLVLAPGTQYALQNGATVDTNQQAGPSGDGSTKSGKTGAKSAMGTGRTPAGAGQEGSSQRLTVNTSVRAQTHASAVPPKTPIDGAWGLEGPTPSPRFPPDLPSLISLGAAEARALVEDYGLTDIEQGVGATSGGKSKTRSTGATREEDLNRFMRFIGLGFELLPSPTATGGAKGAHGGAKGAHGGAKGAHGGATVIRSPIVERPDYVAFAR